MQKQLWNIIRLPALMVLFVSACQPKPGALPTATVTPVQLPTSTATVSNSPTPLPSATPVPPPEPLWSFQTEGAIWGTPSISEGTVYIGSDDGNLYAVDAQTGNPKWKFTTQGIVRSQPAIASGRVYFASDDGYLYALDAHDGTQVWRTDIGDALSRGVREKLGTDTSPTGWDYEQSSPIVVDGQIYVGSLDGNIYALAADTGQVAWTYKTGGKVRATPAVDNGTLYIGSWDKSFYALDAKTGQLRWSTGISGEVQSTALVANDLVYTASRKASVFALDVHTGEIRWEFFYGTNMWVESSPTLVNGIVYIGSSGDRWIMALDSQTGKASATFYSKAFHWSTPAIVDNMLYIGGTSFKTDENVGGLFGLSLVDGKFTSIEQIQWYFPVKETLEAERNWSGVASSPVVVNGVIYFGGLDGKLYAVRTAGSSG